MALKLYQDEGLDQYYDSNPDATDDELEREALRLEREYNTQEAPQRNIARAIARGEETGDATGVARLKAMQQGSEAFGRKLRHQGAQALPYGERYTGAFGQPLSATEAKTREALYPRTMQQMQMGDSFSPVSGIADVASLPGRTAESMGQAAFGDANMLERMSQLEGTGFVSDIVRDPTLMMGGGGGAVSKALPLLKRAGQYALKGMRGQAPVTAAAQAERVERGGELGVGESIGETVVAGFLPLAGKGLKKTFTPIKEFTKDVLSEASGRSKELLNTIGGRELKEWARQSVKGADAKPDEVLEKLRNFSDNATEIANNVIKTVDDFDVLYRQKNETIDKALSAMPDMDALPLMQQLANTKMDIPRGNKSGFPNEIAFNGQIDGMINRIKFKVNQNNPVRLGQLAHGEKQRTFISPHDMLEVRRDIDKAVNWDAETFSKSFFSPIQNLKKEFRTYVKKDLERVAASTGDKTYAPAMKEYSKILDLQDKVKRQIMPRANDLGEVDRATNFLLRLSSPNKLDAQSFARNFVKVLGKDLFYDANFLRLSKEFRDALPIANDIKTGRKNWLQGFMGTTGGKIATAPLSSPKAVAPIMGAMNLAEEGLAKYSPEMRKIQQAVSPVATQQFIGE